LRENGNRNERKENGWKIARMKISKTTKQKDKNEEMAGHGKAE